MTTTQMSQIETITIIMFFVCFIMNNHQNNSIDIVQGLRPGREENIPGREGIRPGREEILPGREEPTMIETLVVEQDAATCASTPSAI